MFKFWFFIHHKLSSSSSRFFEELFAMVSFGVPSAFRVVLLFVTLTCISLQVRHKFVMACYDKT